MPTFDYFLKISGLTGESVTPGHVGDMLINSATIGHGRNLDPVTGQSTGKPLPSVLKVTRLMDSTSVPIGRLVAAGTAVSSVTVFVATEFGDILTMKLSNAIVESVNYSIALGGNNSLMEEYTFSYAFIDTTYMKLLATGALVGGGSYRYTPSL